MNVIENVLIKSVACTLPRQKFTLTEYAPDLVDEKAARKIAQVSGFESLRIAPEDITTSDMCTKSAEALLADQAAKIGAIVFVSKTPDYISPATSHILQARLNLPNDILCLDINEGCSGYMAGIYISATLTTQLRKPVLLCGGDTNSKLTSPDDRGTRCIFGDAGFATLLVPDDDAGKISFAFANYGDKANAIIMENSRHRLVEHPKNGAYYYMDGAAVMNFTLKEVPELITQLLGDNHYTHEDISLFAFHQANKFILTTLAKKLHIPSYKIPFTAGNVGNTSSASIPLLLCGLAGKADFSRVLCAGFGVGLSVGACVADLSRTKFFDITEL